MDKDTQWQNVRGYTPNTLQIIKPKSAIGIQRYPELKSDSPKRIVCNYTYAHFATIPGNVFANYIDIFHKTVVQMVILRCLTCLYLNWFKRYDTKCQKCKNSKNAKLSKLLNSYKNIFKSFQSFLWISQWKIEIERFNISHFKAFGMINMHYEKRICQNL